MGQINDRLAGHRVRMVAKEGARLLVGTEDGLIVYIGWMPNDASLREGLIPYFIGDGVSPRPEELFLHDVLVGKVIKLVAMYEGRLVFVSGNNECHLAWVDCNLVAQSDGRPYLVKQDVFVVIEKAPAIGISRMFNDKFIREKRIH